MEHEESLSLEQAFAEYKHKFGKIPKIMLMKRGLPDEIAIELIEAVESNTPIEDIEDIGRACLWEIVIIF